MNIIRYRYVPIQKTLKFNKARFIKPNVRDIAQLKPINALPYISKEVVTASYYIGKSIIMFTMFYCTLNWMHYRSIRKRYEEDDE